MTYQSLEFVEETRILAEMKIKNRGKIYFPWNKNRQAYFFSMKNKMMDLQVESTKLIFAMNFSVLHFLKFTSRMLQIAQILVSTFKIFPGEEACPQAHLKFPPFFISNSRLCLHIGIVGATLPGTWCSGVGDGTGLLLNVSSL